MRILNRVLELVFAGETLELHRIQAVDHEPAYFLTGNKIRAAIWARLRFFCPLTHTFFAAQLFALTAFHHLS